MPFRFSWFLFTFCLLSFLFDSMISQLSFYVLLCLSFSLLSKRINGGCGSNVLILGQVISTTWYSWCISKAAHGDAICWYTLFGTEKGKKGFTYEGYLLGPWGQSVFLHHWLIWLYMINRWNLVRKTCC